MNAAVIPLDIQHTLVAAVKKYGSGLLRFIRSRVKTDADAEDILQDVWYQLSAVVNAAPIEQTGAWLYTVARNKIIDRYKKKHEFLLDDLAAADEDEDEDSQQISALLLTEATTPETEYLRNLFWEELFAALDELPPEQKAAFVAQELEGKSFKDLAKQTGEPVQTWISRKYYAVTHLRRRLKQLYDDLMYD
ncbi:RNA polymerase sigma factor [Mucilaginibacter koreensis]